MAASSMKKAAHEIESRKRTDDVLLSEDIEFSSLLLSPLVLQGLSSAGFQKPSPIQLKAIPLGRCGLDLIVQAKSGTGKTCVFATIALDSLLPENPGPQVLVLAPTREIAVQIHSVVMAIGSAIEGLECHVFIGGTPVSQDKIRLKKCHIAVGSPGRIKQLIEIGVLSTASIRLFVLDEADKLLEEGSFQEQINWIFSSLPVNKQMLALSATYPESLAQHLTRYMREPTFVRLNPTDPGLIGLKQYYRLVPTHPLPHKVFEEKVQHLLDLYSKVPFNQSLVFSNLHSRAQQLADILSSKGLPAVCISSSLTQDQRLDAMSKLRHYQCRVLISTDLTSRGIDAEKVNLVVNLDVPQDWETYMHRIGRAGRFGTHGLAVTYCCYGEEENKMMMIAQKCSLNITALPDPIPAGLMEERCDWDITIQPPHKDDLSTLSLPRKKKSPKHTDQASPSHHTAAEQVTSTATVEQHSDGPIRKQHSDGPIRNQHTAHIGAVSRPKKAPPPSRPESQAGGVSSPAPAPTSRQRLQDALPKIPPLPSFKPRRAERISLQDAARDFQRFITGGPGRSVEVVRQFRGRAADGQDDVAADGAAELRDETFVLHDDERPAVRLQGRRRMTSDPSSPVSSSSSSESDMETEQKGTSLPPQKVPAARGSRNITRRPTGPIKTEPMQEAHASKHHSQSPQPTTAPPRHLRPPPPPHARGRPLTSPAQRGGSSRGRARRQDPLRMPPAELEEEEDDEEEEAQDYWGRSYSRAWKQYYSSAPPPYRHAYSSAHAWMAAYRMSSIYMQEMMKP
ncbi:probable ATP-dependent RNA helicase DDX20 [Alosa sapidissima]|uniref:probable ATP-dependent RNA helicase DDX20 n=1 Tax=Alosa sapidissima TaxID=34773 RepID=UPI001C089717|nr:probable ATP-dependent RNA helicase DDX20 [Alosa sapidissima]